LSLAPLVLVAIIFLWTPPHFWALALFRSGDYARAGVPMLPVVSGKRVTRWNIFAYTLALVPAGMVPAFIGLGGPLYLACAAGLGAWFVWQSVAVLRERDEASEPAAKRLFGISLLYLFALFAALIGEHLAHIAPFANWM
jgi:protoheme IX farnesyltransferase